MTSGHDDRPALVLFRSDLRIGDNRALHAAAASGRPVVAAFVLDEESPGTRPLGAARRWWLHQSLAAHACALQAIGLELVLRRGAMVDAARRLVEDTGAGAVFWNRRYDPPATRADAALKSHLRQAGVDAHSFDGFLLHEPSRLLTGGGTPYKVYTPFWRALMAQDEPRDAIDRPPQPVPASAPPSDRLADWQLLPRSPDWAGGLRESWIPGEDGASAALDAFLDQAIAGYAEDRDRPAGRTTSRLSPHLVHGEITPFQVLGALRLRGRDIAPRDAEGLRKELAWREFAYHLLFHNPELATRNVQARFDGFPWRTDAASLRTWQMGRTGYPLVDAGMRELWRTGWMHNRVRMVTASFLTKHLLTDWRAGEAWFWDTLVDADPASNPFNWQWVAGCGADAAPYFRIFNPVLQGEKCDPDGDYIRQYVPELARLPNARIHRPWQASRERISDPGASAAGSYPQRIVDHDSARQRALGAFDTIRQAVRGDAT